VPLSPFETFAHLRESICSYLETADRISDPAVFAERARRLRGELPGSSRSVVAQDPFVESTPAFPGTRYLADLVASLEHLPDGLDSLAAFGTPVRDFPLYDHQIEALERAGGRGGTPNLVVATGTGSGKTEIFLLLALADILREARQLPWLAPLRPAQPGTFDSAQGAWLHRRRHERRQPAARTIILYPMNALVNDQLQRLRRILAHPASEAWQRATLANNLIYFGMYTGDAEPTGHWSRQRRRDSWDRYAQEVATTWGGLPAEQQARGNWPRPDGPEMLCRWDVQAAPPDVLITNYSMLEYMLVRPIEAPIFDATRDWLKGTPGARLTLVLDEAHTYTGTRGTEIAHLIRRLKERLDVRSGDGRLRCIATSASLSSEPTARHEICRFAADLFGEDVGTFWSVVTPPPPSPPMYQPSQAELVAFARFAETFDAEQPAPAVDALIGALGRDPPTHASGLQPAGALHRAIAEHPLILRARALTTRRATQLDALAAALWRPSDGPDAGAVDADRWRRATAGVFAAGAFAREKGADGPPLISSRVHMMFRGLPGLWACLDPRCSKVPAEPGPLADAALDPRPSTLDPPERPVGRLYVEPVPHCECGARVLELFACRVCGLLFLGGIPDAATGSLWPWTDDLEGGRADLNDFGVFCVEPVDAPTRYRSVRTTQIVDAGRPDARPVYEVRGAVVNGVPTPFPSECPRCHNHRGRGAEGREIVEPLRTRSSKSFSVLVEDAFRLQPPMPGSTTANQGRKSLTFADSRQDAAALAGDLEIDHNRDLFRQMAYRLLVGCPDCLGFGMAPPADVPLLGGPVVTRASPEPCPRCAGSGRTLGPTAPIDVDTLRRRILRLAERAGINPTMDSLPRYFAQLTPVFNPLEREALQHVDAFLRNEIAAPDFGLEPMGLAAWRAIFPPGVVGALPGLTPPETDDLLGLVTRLLASEGILLPPSLDPRDWGDMVPHWDRNLLAAPPTPGGSHLVPFNPSGRGKLGRYMRSVADAMARLGRIQGEGAVAAWLADAAAPLFRVLGQLGIAVRDRNSLGFGINLLRFQLEAIGDRVHVCRACAYVSNRAVLDVCPRCGGQTELRPASGLRNYYRRTVGFARPGTPLPDPFPLRVVEHSGQIEKPEARRYELQFQDVFLQDEHPDDARIDVLSVTTTMEMGIDIGNLLSVGLRNVPPTVANYQQRAGRAGRRGSGVATVLTYAQNRSHDQYYFDDPPRIVTDAPRIPRLYVDNRVIARRHVRALVLQRFFHEWAPTAAGQGIGGTLNAWGSVGEFDRNGGPTELERWVRANRLPLIERGRMVVGAGHHDDVPAWVVAVPAEVAEHVGTRSPRHDVLGGLLDVGYLPRHAFPLDVVSLWTERPPPGAGLRERGVQRDLGVALSEFAPGAEIIRKKRVHRIVGLYDPSTANRTYHPEGRLVECHDCHAVQLLRLTAERPARCPVCAGGRLSDVPFVRPPGFCTEWVGPEAGGRRYLGGGRERAGGATPARLAVGDDSFSSSESTRPAYAPGLCVLVRVGDLHMVNRGPNVDQPGFRICPRCGRSLGPTDAAHTYPADVPPFGGPSPGPRAGDPCSVGNPPAERVLLGHRFPSEVILLGVELPASLDADVRQASGRAIWLSFGTLVLNAAARVLQINPEELRVGVRSVARPGERLHGEVYLYDTLPGGAGYAREVSAHLEPVLRQALADSRACADPECAGACYRCLLDYQNQPVHGLLDRGLGRTVLAHLLDGTHPALDEARGDELVASLRPYVPDRWRESGPETLGGVRFPLTLRSATGERLGVSPRPALQAVPDAGLQRELLAQGIILCSHTDFDLTRRPHWVMNQIASAPGAV
jgi:hypothetical protein